MSTTFNQRVFGCAVIKSINSNYNADFTHQPRTLPDGTVYATDKALKYTVRHYLSRRHPEEKLFYFRSLSDQMQPRTLDETYAHYFGELPKGKDEIIRKTVANKLLSCIDVRLFGGTFASKNGKANLSLHGPVQISHGMNRYPDGVIYSEQIMSPFRNSGEKNKDSTKTTLGTQSKLSEGHYVHHFSINPHNLDELVRLSGGQALTEADIQKLKEALSSGATLYDSAAKAGTENELMLWIQLRPGSLLVLPSLVDKVVIKSAADRRLIDLAAITELLQRSAVKDHIERVEIYRDPTTDLSNVPATAELLDLHAFPLWRS